MSKAEEIAKEYAKKKFEYMEDDDTTQTTAYRLKIQSEIDFRQGYSYRQSEIDTINNSVKIYNEVIDDQKREIDELRAEVERLKKLILSEMVVCETCGKNKGNLGFCPKCDTDIIN